MKNIEDTIAAIATPPGEGGIGIIRISGERAKEILEALFSAEKIVPRKLSYGFIQDPETKEVVDEVMAVYMPAPGTYTKEDVAEINCHGGSISLSKTLSLVLKQGARMAEPGEFTKRAFLNGRIDLAQAEAVLDVINSKSEASLEAAIHQLQGKFSKEVTSIRNKLIDVLVNVDVNIDYPDEDIEEITYKKLEEGLGEIKGEIKELLESATTGKILREGIKVAIIGKPNAGKSSLLNLLLKESRAIVTDIPGTTRDTIQEFANIRGIPVLLTDTAGIRDTSDEIEKIGIERSKRSLEDADIAILMIDLSEDFDQEVRDLISECDPQSTILVFNKADKEAKITEEEKEKIRTSGGKEGDSTFAEVVTVSLTEGQGVKDVEKAIFDLSGYGNLKGRSDKGGALVTNVRHKDMLENAAKSIEDAISQVRISAPLEIVEIDVRSAYESLGLITGDSVQGDIIQEIFSRFCLGK
ncbi:MAG: tRNA uridine-5-carboxymethylaminomethyl(34) synthesis GTPase MnmE [Firmicutes bacterium]|nr:tRNA uridine-5-carboxymethylaminomethyl(34) synthesis GTPase MnmE [Bacillota bacterium]